MTAWLKIGVGVAALALLAGPQSAFAADAAHPTVVELFQSQGARHARRRRPMLGR